MAEIVPITMHLSETYQIDFQLLDENSDPLNINTITQIDWKVSKNYNEDYLYKISMQDIIVLDANLAKYRLKFTAYADTFDSGMYQHMLIIKDNNINKIIFKGNLHLLPIIN